MSGSSDILISVITLSWDHREYTEAFVKSIRAHTSLPYELIIVDNGSEPETQDWVRQNADRNIIFQENQGFPAGFNAGIDIASGKYLMLANNDTEFPKNWDRRLVEVMEKHPNAGIVSPVYTSGRRIARREQAGDRIIKIGRFIRGPSGVAYFMRRREMIDVFGKWSEEYAIASGEDADLCFTVWDHNYDVYIDERVFVWHKGKVTTSTKLEDWRAHFNKNGKQFRRKWFFEFNFPILARLVQKIKLGFK